MSLGSHLAGSLLNRPARDSGIDLGHQFNRALQSGNESLKVCHLFVREPGRLTIAQPFVTNVVSTYLEGPSRLSNVIEVLTLVYPNAPLFPREPDRIYFIAARNWEAHDRFIY